MMATTAAAANLPCSPQTWKANNPKGRHKVITWERKTKSPSLTACYCSLSETSPLFRAAKHTIDTYIKSGMVIGLGSGQASAMAIKYLGRQIRAGAFKHILGIPTSVVSAREAAKAGIPLGELGNSSQIDFAFDDVDIIEERTLISVIGCQRLQGEESIIQEKLVLSMADQLVFMVTENQYKRGLEGSIPVVIESLNWLETAEEIDDLFLGDAETVFRILRYLKSAPGKAVHFSKHGHLQIEAFTDADWTSSLDDRRSTSRYCSLVGGNLFIWRRKK
ncbi:putative ribose-5-phosphate isomerase 4, chloroplastic isoform X3 [Gossypium australe]|uniref:ribose-5-phosphate isomerase n=1 Tax=Gossypium australe TaxID=47621 RepID=A0A5B6W7U6_9ROSI|nr:putative ribose-5-phosphate isomerase 4, chloroplastic isoform X3 [Gossypium australe]